MIADKIDTRPCWDGGAEIILHIACLNDVKALMDKYVEGKEYTVKIERKRAKRSLDANAYCWVLCKKLAGVLGVYTDTDIYMECIRKYGVSDIRPVKKDFAEDLCRMWDGQGIGNQHVVMGPSKHDGYINIKFYWGSSKYNTLDMSRLIDGIVSDCREQGVETMTPDEIERLKQAWGGG
jgi:hypothetical protein